MNGHCSGPAVDHFISMRQPRRWVLLAVLAWLAVVPTLALALPAYARQTQLACVACHVGEPPRVSWRLLGLSHTVSATCDFASCR
jgi:hypothetical protein